MSRGFDLVSPISFNAVSQRTLDEDDDKRGKVTCVLSSIVGRFEALLALARAFLKRSVREELGSMIKSSIGHVTDAALPSLPPLRANTLVIVFAAFATVPVCPSFRTS